jgi:hypothetical protein
VNHHHTFRHHVTSASLFRRLSILDIDSYFHNRLLRWESVRIPDLTLGLATSHVCPWAGRHGSCWLAGYRILDRLFSTDDLEQIDGERAQK